MWREHIVRVRDRVFQFPFRGRPLQYYWLVSYRKYNLWKYTATKWWDNGGRLHPPECVQVPIMITQSMRVKLVELGHDEDEIREMKPEFAWNLIQNQIRKQKKHHPIITEVQITMDNNVNNSSQNK